MKVGTMKRILNRLIQYNGDLGRLHQFGILNRWARLHEAMRKWIYWFIQRLHTAGFMSVNVGIPLKEAYARLPEQLTPHSHMVSCVRLVTTIMEIAVMRLLRTWQSRLAEILSRDPRAR